MSSIALSFRKKKPEPKLVWHDLRYKDYDGMTYRFPTGWWMPHVPIDYSSQINYLEIGVFYGMHAIRVSDILTNPSSKLYCVDPWQDYDEYSEYKGEQNKIWNAFNQNISKCVNKDKFEIHRGFSDDIVPTFPDNFFDIIFVDGNHETEYVYRDGVMSLQKVKSRGYIIFDDYCNNWPQTKTGINKILNEYSDRIVIIADLYGQLVIQKL